MKIGIGVTTYNRPNHLKLFMEQFYKNIPANDYQIHISDDCYERAGIAYRKNSCLKQLQDNDFIFLFDDDCFPIKKGWDKFFIDAFKISNEHHFLYLKETATIKKIGQKTFGQNLTINIFNNCGGCFMFLTNQIIKNVGAFGEYGFYGYEHAGYSYRINQANLTHIGKYICPENAGEYIYSLDYDNHIDFKIKHKPSMINELDRIQSYIEENQKKYLQDIQQIYKPL